jgi:hypothetical protein
LKPAGDLTILYHLIDQDEGWNKKVVVGTVIQYAPRGNKDRHQRYDHRKRADLWGQYDGVHT